MCAERERYRRNSNSVAILFAGTFALWIQHGLNKLSATEDFNRAGLFYEIRPRVAAVDDACDEVATLAGDTVVLSGDARSRGGAVTTVVEPGVGVTAGVATRSEVCGDLRVGGNTGHRVCGVRGCPGCNGGHRVCVLGVGPSRNSRHRVWGVAHHSNSRNTRHRVWGAVQASSNTGHRVCGVRSGCDRVPRRVSIATGTEGGEAR